MPLSTFASAAGRRLANDPIVVSIGWLLGIAAVWLALAFWRISRAEYATDK